MNLRPPSTLLIFTLGAPRERARRRLLPETARALEIDLYERCLGAALAAGRDAGCRIVAATPESVELPEPVARLSQRGGSFGERLRAAVRQAGAGGGPLVVVGTDVPGLDAGAVRRSLETLERDPDAVVVGPSPDGGFYLLASARPLDAELERVRWCRRDTLHTLLAALAASGRKVTLLAPLRDLDRRADLERWLSETGGGLWRLLARSLTTLLAALRRPATVGRLGRSRPALATVRAVRGPPR